MRSRPVNQEINHEMKFLGLPFQALLLAGAVLGLGIIAGGFFKGLALGLVFFFGLRRFIKRDEAFLDWLLSTLGQKPSYGPKGQRRFL